MLSRLGEKLRLKLPRRIDYERARDMARADDPQLRRLLAQRTDIRPEILYYLAEDADPAVRGAAAANPATPAQADLLLARDRDDNVRVHVAEKIGRLVPGLAAAERDRLNEIVVEVVETLARDQITRVRRALADALKDLPDVPDEVANVVRTLARDAEIVVAGPILQNSPLLTDQDLLDIIASAPADGARTAVARRAAVPEAVSDAIAGSNDVMAVAALLANPSAQIREETLDKLVDLAAEVEIWHEPLVRRPRLSTRAATRLARFVADTFLTELQKRGDLDRHTLDQLAEAVHRRVAQPTKETAEPEIDDARHRAEKLHAREKLGEAEIVEAIGQGDRKFVTAALVLLSRLPSAVVTKIFSSQSGKAVTALTWKAGLSMGCAVQLQLRIGHIAPSAVVHPRSADSFPMTTDELEWQIELFESMAASLSARARSAA